MFETPRYWKCQILEPWLEYLQNKLKKVQPSKAFGISMKQQDLKIVLLCFEFTLAQYFFSRLLVGLIAFCIMLWLWPYGIQTAECIDVNENGSYRLTCLNMWSLAGRPVWEGLSGLALLKKVCNSEWALSILKSHSISSVFLWILLTD